MKPELLHNYLDQRIEELDKEEKGFISSGEFVEVLKCIKAKSELIDVKRFITANQCKNLKID